MAKQTGVVKIKGTVGDLTFTQKGKQNGVQQKVAVSESRFKSDKYERVRENAAEFTSAANASSILRSSFRALLNSFKDKNMIRRMHSLMMVIVKADAINDRGERTVADGPINLLEGFQFNELVKFEDAVPLLILKSVDRATGQVKLNVPAFVPKFDVKGVEGATHFKLVSATAEIDFATGDSVVDFQSTPGIPWNADNVPAQSLIHTITPNSTKDLVVVLGLQYQQQIGNGKVYPFKSNLYNSMSILIADRI